MNDQCSQALKKSKSKEIRQLSKMLSKVTREKNRFLFTHILAVHPNLKQAIELSEYIITQYSAGKKVRRADGQGTHSAGGAIIKILKSTLTPDERKLYHCLRQRSKKENKAAKTKQSL